MEDVPAEQEVRKGAWTPEEDLLLRKCVEEYGEGQWHLVPTRAGLRRCRKSCRQRWLNYLKPTIKRGAFEEDEADLIIRLHMLLGNRWSLIAGRVPGRTANDIKNYWNSCLSKKVGRSRQESDIRIRSCHGAEAYRPSSNESYSVKQLIPFHAHGNGKSPSSARSVVIKPKPLNRTHRHHPIPFPKMDRGHKTATDHELAREDDPSSWLTNLLAGDEEQQREQHEQEGSTSLPSSLASGEELLDMRQCAEEVEAWWQLWWEDMFLDADPLGLLRTVGGESHASNGC